MERSMHFISLIQKALSKADPRKALADAIGQIIAHRDDLQYADEFEMFSSFISEVLETWRIQRQISREAAEDIIEEVTLELTADAVAGSPKGKIALQALDWPPGFIDHLEKRVQTLLSGDDTEHPKAELDVFRNGKTVATIQLELAETSHHIGNIVPGDYAFSLGTGRLLWEVTLDEKDLFLTATDPGKNLPLAAGTDEGRRPKATREMSLINGELVIRVFPGLENGWIEIQERLST